MNRLTQRPLLRPPALATLVVLVSLSLLYLLLRSSSPATSPPAALPGQRYPDDLPVYSSKKIVAVGDLHGSLETALRVLRAAGVVKGKGAGDWALGEGTFVQTGDIVDRGTDTIALYALFDRLRKQASEAGGHVESLLGNHEVMNALSDWRYVTQPDIETFGGLENRRQALTPDGLLGKTWLANYSLTARVPINAPSNSAPISSSFFKHSAIAFLHAGISPDISDNILLPFPEAINRLARSFLFKALSANAPPHPPYPYPGLPSTMTPQEQSLWSGEGVWWYRGYAMDPETPAFCTAAKQVLDKLGVRRMVMGHTPDFDRIVSRCDGALVVIDTGISPAYSGILSALETITTLHRLPSTVQPQHPGLRRRIDVDQDVESFEDSLEVGISKSKPQRWLEREVVVALEMDRNAVGFEGLGRREISRIERVFVQD